MALKRKIDKETWEKLSDEMKPLYSKKGDDYALDVEGGDEDDAGELRRANERLKQEAKDAKKALKDKLAEEEENGELDAKKKGDIATLEKSWKEKTDKQKEEFEGKLTAKDKFIRNSMLDSAAKDVATIAKSPGLIMPHIKQRLDVDLTGDEPVVRVLDKSGKPSSLTLDELKKEFVANKEFSDIIVASKASGGAKPDGKEGGGTLGNPVTDAKVMLSKVDPKDLAATIKAKKEAAAQ